MTTQSQIQATHRRLNSESDAMRLRQLLIDSYRLIGREFNWETRRLEGWYWTGTDAERAAPSWGTNAHIWESPTGDLIGAAIPESPGDIAIQIHPDYRALEADILDWAEAHLAEINDAGQRWLFTWAFEWDTLRQALLAQRGYIKQSDRCYHHRRRHVSEPVLQVTIAEGYQIRSLQPTMADAERWVTCSNATFGQSYAPEAHRNLQLYSPSHNYDLHIVAEAPDGTFAAFAGLTVDETNRCATFEPVGTHPDHRRKGLARAVMFEGIRRLQTLGTVDVVYVANWGPADAGALYEAVGMQHYATTTVWEKTF